MMPPIQHNLPAPIGTLIGREHECEECATLLVAPDCRLVTIVGVGGVGKTRVAIESARRLVQEATDAFPDGIYFIGLASISAEDPLEDTFATALVGVLGITLAGAEAPLTQVRSFIRARKMLLILDNAEHLGGLQAILETLLLEAAELKLLVTSRSRLRILGEWMVSLSGLSFPEAAKQSSSPEAYPAVQLFLQRVRAQGAQIQASSAQVAAEICRLVDGLPLGIELAASWARILALEEIAQEIAQGMDFLSEVARNLPERQQGLRVLFDYSWGLLSAAEQRMLRRLSVFHGRFTAEAAAAICSEPIESGDSTPEQITRRQMRPTLALLASLVDASLLRSSPVGETTRFELLTLVQQYAADQLDEADETKEIEARHAAYYSTWLSAYTFAFRGAGQLTALADLFAALPQLRAAWQRASAAADYASLRRAAPALFHFYDMRSWFREGAAAFGAARQALLPLRADPQAALVLGAVSWRAAWFIFHGGAQREARQLFEETIELLRGLGANAEMVYALAYLASVCANLGEYDSCHEAAEEAYNLAVSLGDRYAQAVLSNVLGQAAYDQGNYAVAQSWSQQSLTIEQATGNRWSMSFSLTNLGKIAYVTEAYAEARWFFEESLETRRVLGDTRGVAICYARLGDVALAAGNPDIGFARYSESLALFRSIGNRWGEASSLTSLARLVLARGRISEGVRGLQDALRLAIDTAATPQIAAILALAAPLVRKSDSQLAEAIGAVLADHTLALERLQPLAERFLAWRGEPSGALSGLTLEQALAALPDPSAWAGRSTAPNPTPIPLPIDNRQAYPAGLTSREVEVLRLVAQGLTDAEVAERLIVSKRTVNSHLSSIYSKIQVNSRSAATRFAFEHGLT